MHSTKDEVIVSSLINEPSLEHQKTGYGLLIRFAFQSWKGNHWKTHQTAMQANTLLLNILESQNPAFISRSTSGCEAVFEEPMKLLQTAILLKSCIQNRSIPATVILYKDQGHMEENIWISSMERQAEYIAFWDTDNETLVMPSLKEGIELPIGVGLLPASRNIQKRFCMSLWTLHIYQDE
ncbi:MAG: hypothetical protein CL916_08970 [Deltaproteobacteria bacterium]|nr:hypothetical protein [Deltaproteobacteria bacterium]